MAGPTVGHCFTVGSKDMIVALCACTHSTKKTQLRMAFSAYALDKEATLHIPEAVKRSEGLELLRAASIAVVSLQLWHRT